MSIPMVLEPPSDADLMARVRDGDRDAFAECASVHDHYYGTPVRALEGALSRGLDVLLDIDTHGARQLRQRYPEAVSIFIMAPSMKELEARLRERRSDAPGEIARVTVNRPCPSLAKDARPGRPLCITL